MGADCAIPMRWRAERKADFDALPSTTRARRGRPHSTRARRWQRAYRGACVPAPKMVSVAFLAYCTCVVDGSDGGMLDVVGFDTTAPVVTAECLRA